jgi:hypothetical protein
LQRFRAYYEYWAGRHNGILYRRRNLISIGGMVYGDDEYEPRMVDRLIQFWWYDPAVWAWFAEHHAAPLRMQREQGWLSFARFVLVDDGWHLQELFKWIYGTRYGYEPTGDHVDSLTTVFSAVRTSEPRAADPHMAWSVFFASRATDPDSRADRDQDRAAANSAALRALERAPESAGAWAWASYTSFEAGDRVTSRALAERALLLAPHSHLASLQLARLTARDVRGRPTPEEIATLVEHLQAVQHDPTEETRYRFESDAAFRSVRREGDFLDAITGLAPRGSLLHWDNFPMTPVYDPVEQAREDARVLRELREAARGR